MNRGNRVGPTPKRREVNPEPLYSKPHLRTGIAVAASRLSLSLPLALGFPLAFLLLAAKHPNADRGAGFKGPRLCLS